MRTDSRGRGEALGAGEPIRSNAEGVHTEFMGFVLLFYETECMLERERTMCPRDTQRAEVGQHGHKPKDADVTKPTADAREGVDSRLE